MESKETARVSRCCALPCASPLQPAPAETRSPIGVLRQSASFIRPYRRCSARGKGDGTQTIKVVSSPLGV